MDKKVNLWPEFADDRYFKSLPAGSELVAILEATNKVLKDITWKE